MTGLPADPWAAVRKALRGCDSAQAAIERSPSLGLDPATLSVVHTSRPDGPWLFFGAAPGHGDYDAVSPSAAWRYERFKPIGEIAIDSVPPS